MPPADRPRDEGFLALCQRLRDWHRGVAPPSPPSREPTAKALRAARKAAKDAAGNQKSPGPMANPTYRLYHEAMVQELKSEYPERVATDEAGFIYGTAHVVTKRHMAALAKRGPCKEPDCVRAKHKIGTYHRNALGLRY